MSYAHLLPPSWKSDIQAWLKEDTPSFDYGGFVVGETAQVATIYCKAEGVLAGVPFVDEIFNQLDCKVTWYVEEGAYIKPQGRVEVARVDGKARHLLLGERIALNVLARCSGIALRCNDVRQIRNLHGFKGIIAATRKTTPGFRLVEKYGVLVGGLDGHRMDLSAMVMLKDNHIWSQGSITKAVQLARSVAGFALKIEVECRSEAEADEALEAGADIVMLDNFTGDGVKAAAKSLKDRWRDRGKSFLVETSGGITIDTCASYFSDDVDILSMSTLTQGVPHVDFSMKLPQPGQD